MRTADQLFMEALEMRKKAMISGEPEPAFEATIDEVAAFCGKYHGCEAVAGLQFAIKMPSACGKTSAMFAK